RIIAATNRKLQAEVSAGRFREDLYYRLAVARVSVPPLRERPEDILPLATHFIREAGGHGLSDLAPEAQALLQSHKWPGNVRELRNVVQRLLIDPAARVAEQSTPPHGGPDPYGQSLRAARKQAMLSFERDYVKELLRRAEGN